MTAPTYRNDLSVAVPTAPPEHGIDPAPSRRAPAQRAAIPTTPLAPPTPRTLVDVLERTATLHPERTAIHTEQGPLTYLGLIAAADRVATRLGQLGIGPGDRVGVRVPSGTADLYVAIIGTLRAGAAYVPVDRDDPETRAETVFESAGVAAVIRDDLAIEPRADALRAVRPLAPTDDAWIIFTSGSTGAPKGVAVSHGSATAFVEAEAQLWTVDATDRVLAGLSVAFDASCEEMWLAWRNGAALVPAPRAVVRSGVDLGPWLAERRVSVVSTVPTLAAMWDDAVLAGVRLLILGGEALPDELAWRLAPGREVWNTYGPTEATVVSTAIRAEVGVPVTIGRPLAGWDVAVLGDDGEVVVPGEVGELVIGGVGLARYLDPALDASKYAPLPALGWSRAYRSGDLVRETPDGLQFLGRRDHQIKLGGRRLELGEVEVKLTAVPGVQQAAAALHKTEAGHPLLVGYIVGDADPATVRETVAQQLPGGVAPLIVVLDALPIATSGKVDRKALPWPPPRPAAPAATHTGAADSPTAPRPLTDLETWVGGHFTAQLGPLALTPDTDFFNEGGSSLAAAGLVSALRERYPDIGVPDLYRGRTLAAIAARLEEIGLGGVTADVEPAPRQRRWPALQLVGVLVLIVLGASQWVVGSLAYDDVVGDGLPNLAWPALLVLWVLLASPMSRNLIVVGLRRALRVDRIAPGRYPRDSWTGVRLWFLSRLADTLSITRLGGTPYAARAARMLGATVGEGARVGTLPPPASRVTIGANATIEGDVDLEGWHVEGSEIVVGEIVIGSSARVGTRALLNPGTVIGAGAEIEPGAVVDGIVPAGERWAGSPARKVGMAGELWPDTTPEPHPRARRWRLAFAGGMILQLLLPILALVPAGLLLWALGLPAPTLQSALGTLLVESALLATGFMLGFAVLTAAVQRALRPLLRPGLQGEDGPAGFALWMLASTMDEAHGALFPVYASIYMRPWLRLMGLQVGRRAEVSTAVGLSALTSFGERSFVADDAVLRTARARNGWLELAPIHIGEGTFVGNGAMLAPGTTLGCDSLVGLLSDAPTNPADGTSWYGTPAIELPRVPDPVDAARTTQPPRHLIAARAFMDLVRIIVPTTLAIAIGWFSALTLDAIGADHGIAVMILASPGILLAAGIIATAITIALKWTVIGRYRAGEHPLWSWFIWRDEFMNSTQERLAGAWLLGPAVGTPIMALYLRLLGAKVGRGVWCETLAVTEFDMVTLDDGASVNRRACIETHLFHDRLMRIGAATLHAGASLGPSSAVLPDAAIGAGTSVGGRSVVSRGERLPAATRWVGAPVQSAPRK